MRSLNTILAICLFFSVLSCDSSTKKKSISKILEPTNKSKDTSSNKLNVFETEPETQPTPEIEKKTIGYIKICDIQIGYEDTLVLKNTVEYHLNNGIIYIKEFYPNKKLKSESYWVDNIIPVYQIKQYKKDGTIKRIIDKSIGKYDLCYVLNKIKTNPILSKKKVHISINDNFDDDVETKSWSVTYDHSESEYNSHAKGIYFNSKTGRSSPGGYSISDEPVNFTRPTKDQLPTFPGGIKKFENYVANSINIQPDSLKNAEVFVMYSVDPYGIVSDFQTQGATNYLNNEVLKIVRKMPNWTPAKDKRTDGASNVEGEYSKEYTFVFSVYFRRFE